MSVYDTLAPVVVLFPAETTERGFTLSKRGSDTSLVDIVGNRVVARAAGTAYLMAVTQTGGIVDYFFLTVLP